jgi:hypothetical protein
MWHEWEGSVTNSPVNGTVSQQIQITIIIGTNEISSQSKTESIDGDHAHRQ